MLKVVRALAPGLFPDCTSFLPKPAITGSFPLKNPYLRRTNPVFVVDNDLRVRPVPLIAPCPWRHHSLPSDTSYALRHETLRLLKNEVAEVHASWRPCVCKERLVSLSCFPRAAVARLLAEMLTSSPHRAPSPHWFKSLTCGMEK